jgi:cytidylate kinase
MENSDQKILVDNTKAIETLPSFFKVKSAYKQTSEVEYNSYITSLNWHELERHASSVGVIPSVRASKGVLIEKLRKKFIIENANNVQSSISQDTGEKSVLTKDEESILNKFFSRSVR